MSRFDRIFWVIAVGVVGCFLGWLVVPAWALAGATETAAAAAEEAATEPATGGGDPFAQRGVPEEVGRQMQDRAYDEAIAAIDAALAAGNGPADYLLYLKGRALHLLEKYDEAVQVFDQVAQRHAGSPWARRARFAKGATFARKGDFRAAELAYRAEAEFLLSLDRKEEIAAIYLEFADAYFQPPKKEDKQPDYGKALEFYQRAIDVGPKPATRASVELKIAECQQRLGNHAQAAELFQRFLKEHDDSPLLVEARFQLGESLMAQGNRVEARRTWQDLLALNAGGDAPRLAEAQYRIAATFGLPQPGSAEDLSLGVAALRAFLEKHPRHELAGPAHLMMAQSQLHLGRIEEAVAVLQGFIGQEQYAAAEEVPAARKLLGELFAMQRKFDEALDAFRDYLGKHPTHEGWSEVQRKIIDVEYLKALDRFQQEDYAPARQLWQEFLAKYPLDGRAREILFRFGQIEYNQRRWTEALDAWRQLVSKYPNTNEASQAQYMIAATLEERLGKLEEALEEYRKVSFGSHQGQAQSRIARLVARQMEIATERVFRSDETPQIALTTRNIERVTVRVYAVDLETYFRKMHLARGVEGLDIALIDPDRTFEFEIPQYQKHQRLESAIPLPLPAAGDDDEPSPRAGVIAVTVSSETLEATTLVVQSDLDVIVKSSRDEAFVFAQNLRTGEPWPAARVLLSDGDAVFAEAATGDDGVFRAAFDELKAAGDVRAFAVDGGHTASNVVGLSGVGVARGLTNRGYIYTDRPAYRAGQVVFVRGVIRQVTDDRYTVEEGKEYQIEVFDPRNRLIHTDQVQLSAFGSFHTRMLLPAVSPQGQYRIVVADEAQRETYQGVFTVQQYQLEPVRIEIDTERAVFYRGEEIEGKIKVSYYYGAPVAAREIQYRLADGRTITAQTDERGEVAFRLPTREFREAQPLLLAVTLPERNLSAGKTFFLATQGFTLSASTVRDVYLVGDTFEVQVTAADAEGKPIAQPLTLRVLKKTRTARQVGEVQVEEHPLTTEEKDGVARKTLRLAEGGDYLLRFEGTDRFGNVVTCERGVKISGDDDAVRLRILADRHTYKVGDTAELTLHWREQPALALVTFEGARILDYRLVQLAASENRIEVPITAELAPNFEFAAAVMIDPPREAAAAGEAASADDAADAEDGDGGGNDAAPGEEKVFRRFHTASSPFVVERDLRVAIALRREDGVEGALRPGDEVEATIVTTDPQARPVAAEVSLAMVEQALLARFASPLPAVQEFFRGAARQSAMRTTSSIEFAYRPATRPIHARLLAERDRLQTLHEEERRLAELRESGRVTFDELSGGFDHGALAPDQPAPEDAFGEPASRPQGIRSELAQQLDQLQTWGDLPADGRFAAEGERQRQMLRTHRGLAGPQAAQQMAMSSNGDADFSMQLWNGQAEFEYRAGDREQSAATYFGYIAPLGGSRSGAVPEVTGGQLKSLVESSLNEVQALQQDGTWANVNLSARLGGRWDAAEADRLARRLSEEGVLLLPQLPPHETGYWNPAVVTDEEGKAAVTFTLPERSTAWRLLAKGITAETLGGEAEHEFAVKKDLFGQLKLPAALTDGDRVDVTASIHNDLAEAAAIEVTLKTTLGEKTVIETKKLEAAARGVLDVTFPAAIVLAGEAAESLGGDAAAVFELTVAAGERRDVVRRSVPVRPYGEPVFAIDGGSASSSITSFVQPPPGVTLAARQLEVIVGPTVEQSLLDVLFGAAPWCQRAAAEGGSSVESAASDLMAGVALQKLLAAGREAGNPQAESIDARIRSAVSLLVSLQLDDGGWSWAGQGAKGDRYSSARVVWALQVAKKAGYRVPDDTLARAAAFLQSQLAAAAVTDYETKAILLHALTVAGQEDFPLANQLYRNRPSLSNLGLLYLTLAFAEMDRKQTAAELLGVAAERNLAEAGPKRTAPQSSLPWGHAQTELRALYALALNLASPADPRLAEQVEWLMARRTGHRWSPDKATGPAMLALGDWYARTKFQDEHYKLTVFVNDLQAAEIEVREGARTQTIRVPAELLADAPRQRVRFELTGRGRYSYQCILSGFVPAERLASTTEDWTVRRYYEPAPRELDGETIPRGFGVLQGSYSSFRNPMTQLPVARRAQVELELSRFNVPNNTPEEHLEYLVVNEPIAAGATVVEESIRGNFERYELSPGAITFYVGTRRYPGTIRYDLHGYLPGEYRTAPTVVRNAFAADQMAVAETKPLTVLPLGEQSSDAYRLTPQELYELGRRYFDRGDLDQAGKHLGELFAKWNLQPQFYKETARMLFDVHLATGPPAEVVRYFEVLIEKYPELEISFAKLMQVGDAYHELGEYERSYLVFRATVEASFLRESQVAGFLDGQGEFLRSVDVMASLLRQYPPEGYVAAASYFLAQRVYGKAASAADDPRLKEKKITRVDLIRRALGMLDSFLTANPDDPAADQASFSLAGGLLELELYEDAIAACQRYALRYPQSRYLDHYWYIVGYCHFARGEHQEAIAMCRKVAELRRRNPDTGRDEESVNKWQAVYILGQVFHSLGQAQQAIAEYERVKDRFEDARQAIDYFLRREVALPEVTTVRPGEAVELPLAYRNVKACDAMVYRIDLMKFSLLKKDLGGIANINLSGIRPYFEQTFELGDGKDYRDKSKPLALPLKEEGAYLVVCRADNLHASGLVLVSPLAVEVQEEVESGRVRATIRDVAEDRFVSQVHVKVVGSANDNFVSGDTDLRGVFVADGIVGESTVIAEARGGRYAFFRGEKFLGVPPRGEDSAPAAQPAAPPEPGQGKAGGKQELLEELFEYNYRIQGEQGGNLDAVYDNEVQEGVQHFKF